MPTTREFTPAELTALGVPPNSPQDVQWSETLLSDTHVCVLKYSQQRRAVFTADDGLTYAVTYEAPLDAGDYETGPAPDGHGWYGPTVTATRVVSWPVVVQEWQPYSPARHYTDRTRTAFEELTDVYEEGGCRTPDAREFAAELLAKHAAELAAPAPGEEDGEPYVLDAVGRRVRTGDTVGGTTSGRYQATITGPVLKLGKGQVKIRVAGDGDGGYRPAGGDERWISTGRIFLVAPSSS
jgi:hypothetical protein